MAAQRCYPKFVKFARSHKILNASLGSVLDAFGKAFDCNIGIDKAQRARKVTADLSDLAFLSALNALHNQSGMTAALKISVSCRGSEKKMLLTLSPIPGK